VCTASHYRLIKSGRLGVDLAAGLPHRDGGLAVLQELLGVILNVDHAGHHPVDGADVADVQRQPVRVVTAVREAGVDPVRVVDFARPGALAVLESDGDVVVLRQAVVRPDVERKVVVEADAPTLAALGYSSFRSVAGATLRSTRPMETDSPSVPARTDRMRGTRFADGAV